MVLKEQNENRRVFENESGIYVLVKNKNGFDEDWILVSYDSNDEFHVQIEAIENAYGNYMKLITIQNNMERDILLDNGEVVDDKIKLSPQGMDESSNYEDYVYINKISNPEKLEKYLMQKQEFVNSNGKKFYGMVANNYYLLNFLKCNRLLSRIDLGTVKNTKKM